MSDRSRRIIAAPKLDLFGPFTEGQVDGKYHKLAGAFSVSCRETIKTVPLSWLSRRS